MYFSPTFLRMVVHFIASISHFLLYIFVNFDSFDELEEVVTERNQWIMVSKEDSHMISTFLAFIVFDDNSGLTADRFFQSVVCISTAVSCILLCRLRAVILWLRVGHYNLSLQYVHQIQERPM